MQVTKGTWRMREQCVPGSLYSTPAREPGNEAMLQYDINKVSRVKYLGGGGGGGLPPLSPPPRFLRLWGASLYCIDT